MLGQLGSWDECLAFTAAEDTLAWLDSLDVGRRVLVSVDEASRTVTVMPDRLGHRVCFRGLRNAMHHGVTVNWRLLGKPLPRFELMEISLEPTDGVAFEIRLPSDHMLPWPKLRECEGYCPTEVAMAELERRMESAARQYGSRPSAWSWVYPTSEICSLLPSGFWTEALRRAISRSRQ